MFAWRRTYPNTASWLTYQLLMACIFAFCMTQPTETLRYLSFNFVVLAHNSTWGYFAVLLPMLLAFFVLDLLVPAANKPELWPEADRLERRSIERQLSRFTTWQVLLATFCVIGLSFWVGHFVAFRTYRLGWLQTLLYVPFYLALFTRRTKNQIAADPY